MQDSVDLREAVAANRGTITDLGPSRQVRVRPPDLMIGAVTPDLLRTYYLESVVHGATVIRVRDVEVLREGVVLVDGAFATCCQINIDPDYAVRFHPDLARAHPRLPRRLIDGDVVLLAGIGHTVFGHWLVDFLPKLYVLHRAGYRLDRLTFLLPTDTPDFARAWLAALGLDAARFLAYDPTGEVLACRSLIVPGVLRHGSRVSPLMSAAREFLLDRLGQGRRWWSPPPRRRRRLLVARSETSTLNRRRLAERDLFEARAIAHGFALVRPEALPIIEQVALFRSAAAIVGEYGSGLHGSLFAEPGAVVVSVRNGDPLLGFLQSGIDHAVGNDSGYVVGSLPGVDGGFSVAARDIDGAFDWLGWERRA